jgi:N-acetylmuramoyl-L-alanine amidase
MKKIAISSGHGKYIRGASGYLDEVDEARRVVDKVAEILRAADIDTPTFHDDTSHDQSTNLHTIVNWHNDQLRDLDVSVHFNAYETTSKPMGCEVLYVTQSSLAGEVSAMISRAGHFLNRGAKKRTDLFFLNNTEEPAILIETCFVDSSADAGLYEEHFRSICLAIAEAISGRDLVLPPEELPPIEPPTTAPIAPDYDKPVTQRGDYGPYVLQIQTALNVTPLDSDFGAITEQAVMEFQEAQGLMTDGIVGPQTWGALEYVYDLPEDIEYPQLEASGKVSWFGGPNDMGVAPDEGLAFIYHVEQAPDLFLDYQPSGTSGLARRLDPEEHYIAMRWDYDLYPKEMLASGKYHAMVRAPATGKEFKAMPADWGPHGDTNRVADISPGLMELLGIETDDEVEVTFPA